MPPCLHTGFFRKKAGISLLSGAKYTLTRKNTIFAAVSPLLYGVAYDKV